MNRIDRLFREKKKGILNLYCTAGFPQRDSTLAVLESLQKHGADMVELGIPYSDPLADGPVIQQSNQESLQNGMQVSLLFEQLKDMRKTINLPVILMGYLNPVLQYGLERFCSDAAATGVDGVILPDLPVDAYETLYKDMFEKHGLYVIFLVTPQTGEERIRKIDSLSKGFLYAVSSASITGGSKGIAEQAAYFQRLRAMPLHNPVLIGFGIKERSDLELAGEYAQGAIIGSAYIDALRKEGTIDAKTKEFINTLIG